MLARFHRLPFALTITLVLVLKVVLLFMLHKAFFSAPQVKKMRMPTAQVEHEASTSRVSEDQLFYCMQRGISQEDAVSLIVNGFCKEVFDTLPMEFAVEARNLLGVSLEGSVG